MSPKPAAPYRGDYAVYSFAPGDEAVRRGRAIWSKKAAQHQAYALNVITKSVGKPREHWVDTVPPTQRIEAKYYEKDESRQALVDELDDLEYEYWLRPPAIEEKPEIIACPFCGAPPPSGVSGGSRVGFYEDRRDPGTYCFIVCENCKAQGPMVEGVLREHEIEAIKKWSARKKKA